MIIAKAADPPLSLLQGHRRITDAWLFLLARQHNGTPATLDARLLHAVAGSAWEERLSIIHAG